MTTTRLHRQNAFRIRGGQSPHHQVLSTMVERGDVLSLFRLLRDGSARSCESNPDDHLTSLLLVAAQAKQPDVFCLLLVCGAEIDQTHSLRRTADGMPRRNGEHRCSCDLCAVSPACPQRSWAECSAYARRTREVRGSSHCPCCGIVHRLSGV
jgi:hypothetical protein